LLLLIIELKRNLWYILLLKRDIFRTLLKLTIQIPNINGKTNTLNPYILTLTKKTAKKKKTNHLIIIQQYETNPTLSDYSISYMTI